jgi:AspT/YidE/YbjL antiporter-like protein
VVDFFADDAILLVFLVVGLGAGIGAVPVRGVSLGPAAALFVGLAVGALDEALSEAEGLGLLRELGRVLFTYTVGLASGPTFLAGLRRGGAQAVALTTALVVALAGLCSLAAAVLDLSAADRAGLFAGSATNSPALQAASDAVEAGDPVVAYSIAYPMAIASMWAFTAVFRAILVRRIASTGAVGQLRGRDRAGGSHRVVAGEPAAGPPVRQRPKIDPKAAGFVAAAPFMVLATTSASGTDASPRGGPPGFVTVLDEHRLAFGDLSGNNRLDSYSNIVEHPQVGLLFLVAGVGETLRVNGRASITTDPAVLERTAINRGPTEGRGCRRGRRVLHPQAAAGHGWARISGKPSSLRAPTPRRRSQPWTLKIAADPCRAGGAQDGGPAPAGRPARRRAGRAAVRL